MVVEVIRVAHKSFVSRDARIVFEGVDQVECELHLGKVSVQIGVRAISVEPRSCGNDIVLCCADSAFASVRSFLILADQFPFQR